MHPNYRMEVRPGPCCSGSLETFAGAEYGYCVVQNSLHSGTLRAMSESVSTSTHQELDNQRGQRESADAGQDATPVNEPRGAQAKKREIGGPEGPEPTRYGDWERKGRCIDF